MKAKNAAITATPPFFARDRKLASTTVEPIVNSGSEAIVTVTTPNSHSADLKDVGYHCEIKSIAPTSNNNQPSHPNNFQAVRGAAIAIGSTARRSAWIRT